MANRNTDDFIIMIADDDGDDVVIIKKALQAAGFKGQVTTATDGEHLMEQLTAGARPDLLLLDLNMPRKSGLEALREIKAHPALKLLPVIIFSTSNRPIDIQECYRAGANSYIVKPMAYAAITGAIRTLSDYWLGQVVLPSRSE